MNALVVGSGDMESVELIRKAAGNSQLLICADGGARHFQKAGIFPDVLLGDFDSIAPELYNDYLKAGIKIVRFPAQKDYTDMELAVDYAVEQGASRIFILGAVGTRLDHTLSNLHLLHKLLDAGAEGIIINDYNEIYLIQDRIVLEKKEGLKVSLVPATCTVEGITTRGLAYPLTDFTMKMGTGLGISNEFISETAEVRIKKGRLYIILARD